MIMTRRRCPGSRTAHAAPARASNSAVTPAKKTLTSFVKNRPVQILCRRLSEARYPAGEAENWATTDIGRLAPPAAALIYGHNIGSASDRPPKLAIATAETDRHRRA